MSSAVTAASKGSLYLVATPIGNLGDISARALDTLKKADCIACEDTRTTGKLLERFEIKAQLLAYHDHNETQAASQLADFVESGKQVCLVSDAGMPAISDPGFRVVRECRKRKLPVVPIPGACAAVTALAASGLPSDAFLFLGFMAPKKSARLKTFEEHKNAPYSLVFYESTHRILKFMEDAIEVFGEGRYACIAREMTKLHETFLTDSLGGLLSELKTRSTKGEFVVIIAKEGFEL